MKQISFKSYAISTFLLDCIIYYNMYLYYLLLSVIIHHTGKKRHEKLTLIRIIRNNILIRYTVMFHWCYLSFRFTRFCLASVAQRNFNGPINATGINRDNSHKKRTHLPGIRKRSTCGLISMCKPYNCALRNSRTDKSVTRADASLTPSYSL